MQEQWGWVKRGVFRDKPELRIWRHEATGCTSISEVPRKIEGGAEENYVEAVAFGFKTLRDPKTGSLYYWNALGKVFLKQLTTFKEMGLYNIRGLVLYWKN